MGTLGGTGGVQFAVSTADTVQDLAGPFVNGSGSAADGYGGSVDGFYGKNHDGCKNVIGAGITVGGGAGAFAFDGVTNTVIGPAGHIW